MARKIEVVITGDSKSLERALGKASKSSEKFGRAAGRAGVALGTGLVVAGGFAVKAAVDLNEQINKSNVVFGRNAKEIKKWSGSLARDFGLSQRAALEAAGTFGNMLKPMGLAPPLVAKISTTMTELAGDLASFNNASPEDTLEALRAGLAGETEPLRRFGIFLSDARLKQEALTLGLYKGKGALDASAKAQATFSLVMKDSKDAQGDFARTSDSLANQQRILRAELENVAAQLGNELIPIMTQVAQHFLAAIQYLKKNETQARALAVGIGVLAAALVTARAAQIAMNLAVLANPYVAAAAAVVALAAGVAYLYLKYQQIRPVIIAVVAVVLGFASALVLAYRESATFRNVVNAAFNAIVSATRAVTASIMAIVHAIQTAVSWVQRLIDAIKSIPDAPGGIIDKVKGGVASVPRVIRPRAIGGPVTAGMPYMVGERGRELFVPNTAGRIIPNGRFGGGAGTVVFNFPNYVGNERDLMAAVRSEVTKLRRRGGSF